MILRGCIIPILWVRKLSTGEFQQLTQDHTTKNRTRNVLLESQMDFVVNNCISATGAAYPVAHSSLHFWVVDSPGTRVTGVSCSVGVKSEVHIVIPNCSPLPSYWKPMISGRSTIHENV